MSGYFIILSIVGILIGVFLAFTGFSGHGIGATVTLIVGVFMAIKEILDIAHAS